MTRTFRPKEWTVMMFIANDNNLGAFTKKKIAEIGSVGSTAATDVVIQYDSLGENKVRRFRLSKGQKYRLSRLQGETNTGDKRVITKFVDHNLEDFDPNRMMLVISNHGTGLAIATDESLGTKAPLFRKALREKRIARRRDTGSEPDLGNDALDLIELKAALTETTAKHGRFELLAFDACLMSTFEVAHQVRHGARFMVGSQSNIPVPGFRFAPVFRLMRDKAISTSAVAENMAVSSVPNLVEDEYAALAALDLDKADVVAEAISVLAAALTNVLDENDAFQAISLAHLSALALPDSETIDLFDFCQRLSRTVDNDVVRIAATTVLVALGQFVLRANPLGALVEGARGVSITLPKRNYLSDAYRQLDFARDTNWVRFLEAYLERRFPPVPEDPLL